MNQPKICWKDPNEQGELNQSLEGVLVFFLRDHFAGMCMDMTFDGQYHFEKEKFETDGRYIHPHHQIEDS